MRGQRESKESSWVKRAAVSCLCLGLVIAGVLLFFSYREDRQHRESIVRFGGYCLQMDGTLRFVMKTAEPKPVMEEEIIEVRDWEIFEGGEVQSMEPGEIDPDVLRTLLSKKSVEVYWQEPKSGHRYYLLSDDNVFQKYENETLVWEIELPIYSKYSYVTCPIDERVAVAWKTEEGQLRLVFIGADGRIRWEYQGQRELRGNFYLRFSEGILHLVNFNYRQDIEKTELTMLTFDLQGTLLSEKTNTIDKELLHERLIIRDGRYVANGYFGKVKNTYTDKRSMLEISFDGELLKKTDFTLNRKEGFIKNILYHEGKTYISVLFCNVPTDIFYRTTVASDLEEYTAACEAAGVDIFGDFDMGEEFDTRVKNSFREQYTAALLIFDENDSLSGAYTMEGAYCKEVTLSENNEVVWEIYRIDHVLLRNRSITSAYVYSTGFCVDFSNGVMAGKRQIGYGQHFGRDLY